jgi:hypothetical protein
MGYEDLHSNTRESIERLKRKRLLKQQEENDYLKFLQEIEKQRREKFLTDQLLKDLQRKAFLVERENQERIWRAKDLAKRTEEFVQESIKQQEIKELNMMRAEDLSSSNYHKYIHAQYLQQKMQKKEYHHIQYQRQQHYLIHDKTLVSVLFKQKKSLTYQFLTDKLTKQFDLIYNQLIKFLYYLPFHKSYQEKIIKKFYEIIEPTFLKGVKPSQLPSTPTSEMGISPSNLNAASFDFTNMGSIVTAASNANNPFVSQLPPFRKFFISRYIDFLLYYYNYNYDSIYEEMSKYDSVSGFTSVKYDLNYIKNRNNNRKKSFNKSKSASLLLIRKFSLANSGSGNAQNNSFMNPLIPLTLTEADFIHIDKKDLIFTLRRFLDEYSYYNYLQEEELMEYEHQKEAMQLQMVKNERDKFREMERNKLYDKQEQQNQQKKLKSSSNDSNKGFSIRKTGLSPQRTQRKTVLTKENIGRSRSHSGDDHKPTVPHSYSFGYFQQQQKQQQKKIDSQNQRMIRTRSSGNLNSNSLFSLLTVQNMMKNLKDCAIVIPVQGNIDLDEDNEDNQSSAGQSKTSQTKSKSKKHHHHQANSRRKSTFSGQTSSSKKGSHSISPERIRGATTIDGNRSQSVKVNRRQSSVLATPGGSTSMKVTKAAAGGRQRSTSGDSVHSESSQGSHSKRLANTTNTVTSPQPNIRPQLTVSPSRSERGPTRSDRIRSISHDFRVHSDKIQSFSDKGAPVGHSLVPTATTEGQTSSDKVVPFSSSTATTDFPLSPSSMKFTSSTRNSRREDNTHTDIIYEEDEEKGEKGDKEEKTYSLEPVLPSAGLTRSQRNTRRESSVTPTRTRAFSMAQPTAGVKSADKAETKLLKESLKAPVTNNNKSFDRNNYLLLKYRYQPPQETLLLFVYLIQYKYLKKLRVFYYQQLFYLINQFDSTLKKLNSSRDRLKKEKLLRYERQMLLKEAEKCELLLISYRNHMISYNYYLYELIYYEVRFFLLLFYSKNPGQQSTQQQSQFFQFMSSKQPPPPKPVRRNSKSAGLGGGVGVGGGGTTSSRRGGGRRESNTPGGGEGGGGGGGRGGSSRRQSTLAAGGGAAGRQQSIRGETGETTTTAATAATQPSVSRLASSSNDYQQQQTTSTTAAAVSLATISTESAATTGAGKGPSAAYLARKQSILANAARKNSIINKTSSTDSTNRKKTTSNLISYEKWRTFNHEKDDHDFYWYDLMQLSQDISLTSLELFKIFLLPPRVCYDNDGFRHVYKVNTKVMTVGNTKGSMIMGLHGSSPPSKQHKTLRARGNTGLGGLGVGSESFTAGGSSSPKKNLSIYNNNNSNNTNILRKDSIAIPMIVSGTSFNQAIARSFSHKGGAGSTSMMNTTNSINNPLVKERNFFNIPGENIFLENDHLAYDFVQWSLDIIKWIQNILGMVNKYEKKWFKENEHEILPLLHRFYYLFQFLSNDVSQYQENLSEKAHYLKRFSYITNFYESSTVDYNQHQQEKAAKHLKNTTKDAKFPQEYSSSKESFVNSFFYQMILQKFYAKEIDICDLFELQLCRSNVSINLSSMEEFPPKILSNYTLLSKDLDEILGKHPISLLTRQIILSEIEKTDLVPIKWLKANMNMQQLVQQHDNALLSNLFQVTEVIQNPFLSSGLTHEQIFEKYWKVSPVDPLVSHSYDLTEKEAAKIDLEGEDQEEKSHLSEEEKLISDISTSEQKKKSIPAALSPNSRAVNAEKAILSMKNDKTMEVPTNPLSMKPILGSEDKPSFPPLETSYYYLPRDLYLQKIFQSSKFLQQEYHSFSTVGDNSSYNYNYSTQVLSIIEKEYYELQETVSMLVEMKVLRIQENTIVHQKPVASAVAATNPVNERTPSNRLDASLSMSIDGGAAGGGGGGGGVVPDSVRLPPPQNNPVEPANNNKLITKATQLLPSSTNVSLLYQPWLLFNPKERNQYYHRLVEQIQTEKDWFYVLPLYVQPILYFGKPAKEESYEQRILREFAEQQQKQQELEARKKAKEKAKEEERKGSFSVAVLQEQQPLVTTVVKKKRRRNSIKEFAVQEAASSIVSSMTTSKQQQEQPAIGKYLVIYLKDFLFSYYAKVLQCQFLKRSLLYQYVLKGYHSELYVQKMEPFLFEYEDHRSRVVEEIDKQKRKLGLSSHQKKGKPGLFLSSLSSPRRPSPRKEAAQPKTSTTVAVDCCSCFGNYGRAKIYSEKDRFEDEDEIIVLRKALTEQSSVSPSYHSAVKFLKNFPSKLKQRKKEIAATTLSASSNYAFLFKFILYYNYSFEMILPNKLKSKNNREEHDGEEVNSLITEENNFSFDAEGETPNEGEEVEQFYEIKSDEGGDAVNEERQLNVVSPLYNEDEETKATELSSEGGEEGDSSLFEGNASIFQELDHAKEKFLSSVYESVFQYLRPSREEYYENPLEELNEQISFYYEIITEIRKQMKVGNPFIQQKIVELIQSRPEYSMKNYSLPQHLRSWITGEALGGTRSSLLLKKGATTASSASSSFRSNDLVPTARSSNLSASRRQISAMKSGMGGKDNSVFLSQQTLNEREEETSSAVALSTHNENDNSDWMKEAIESQKDLFYSLNDSIMKGFYEKIIFAFSKLIISSGGGSERKDYSHDSYQLTGFSTKTVNMKKPSSTTMQDARLIMSNCEELLIFGGMSKILSLTRIVEDSEIQSTRGVTFIEEYYSQSFNLLKVNSECLSAYPSLFSPAFNKTTISTTTTRTTATVGIAGLGLGSASEKASGGIGLGGKSTLRNSFSLGGGNPSLSLLERQQSNLAAMNNALMMEVMDSLVSSESIFNQSLYSLLKQSLLTSSFLSGFRPLTGVGATSSSTYPMANLSLMDLLHHSQFGSFLRSGFLHFKNSSANEDMKLRRFTSISGKLLSSTSGRTHQNTDEEEKLNLLATLDGKRSLLFLFFMKIRYKYLLLENNWKLMKGIVKCQSIVRGKQCRKRVLAMKTEVG